MKFCKCGCNGIPKSGNRFIHGHSRKGIHLPEETRKKISRTLVGKHSGPNNPFYGKHHTKQTKQLISKKLKGVMIGPKNPRYGKKNSEDHRRKLSIAITGKFAGSKNPSWKGGISFEPYHPKFNFKLKEKIREDFDRKCFLCGINENDYYRSLDIHHIDGDKKQDGITKPWFLVPLCESCHSKIQHNEKHWNGLIISKLQKGEETYGKILQEMCNE